MPFSNSQSASLKIQTRDASYTNDSAPPSTFRTDSLKAPLEDLLHLALLPQFPSSVAFRGFKDPTQFLSRRPHHLLPPCPSPPALQTNARICKSKDVRSTRFVKKPRGAPFPSCQHPPPPGKKKSSHLLSSVRKWGTEGAPNILPFLPLPQFYYSPKEMRRRKGVCWGGGRRVRREERKEPLTGDLEMCAEQGSSEEYKSQLGYPNTSKTILHISANTFGAGGPGQPQHSHTCTHTRMHTCTHTRRAPSASSSSTSSTFLHLPCASSASEAFFLVH